MVTDVGGEGLEISNVQYQGSFEDVQDQRSMHGVEGLEMPIVKDECGMQGVEGLEIPLVQHEGGMGHEVEGINGDDVDSRSSLAAMIVVRTMNRCR
ncbi:hypothetical protein L2E82_31510 [Cichorium intybus]|uniref:Uncharacterized protein n=1 Tax=Cichorium intybus TaxID=13427 RepID=A0ACB9BEL6_CICIN|nr:hypothetical protein L2E82_31510 [Cichorium intybus]